METSRKARGLGRIDHRKAEGELEVCALLKFERMQDWLGPWAELWCAPWLSWSLALAKTPVGTGGVFAPMCRLVGVGRVIYDCVDGEFGSSGPSPSL